MKKVIRESLLLAIILLLCSCGQRLRPVEYVQYVQSTKNGLKKVVSISHFEYSIQYKPYEYIILMENKGNTKAFDIKKRIEELKGTAWFNVSFKLLDGAVSPMRYNLTSKDEYDQRLNYFLNQAMQNIQLIYDNKDTLNPTGYLFENNYNLTPQETFVVGFKLPDGADHPQKDMQIAYDDKVFKNGIIKTKYNSGDLKGIPTLIY